MPLCDGPYVGEPPVTITSAPIETTVTALDFCDILVGVNVCDVTLRMSTTSVAFGGLEPRPAAHHLEWGQCRVFLSAQQVPRTLETLTAALATYQKRFQPQQAKPSQPPPQPPAQGPLG